MPECPKSFCLVKLMVNVCEAALGPVSMMLCCVIVNNVTSTDHLGDAQDRLLWKDKTCLAYLAHMSWKAYILSLLLL